MKRNKKYMVDPSAETVLSIAASFSLIFGSLVSVAFLVVGDLLADSFDMEIVLYAGIAVCLISLCITCVSWAKQKVIVNISRSLYNINEAVRNLDVEQKEAVAETTE